MSTSLEIGRNIISIFFFLWRQPRVVVLLSMGYENYVPSYWEGVFVGYSVWQLHWFKIWIPFFCDQLCIFSLSLRCSPLLYMSNHACNSFPPTLPHINFNTQIIKTNLFRVRPGICFHYFTCCPSLDSCSNWIIGSYNFLVHGLQGLMLEWGRWGKSLNRSLKDKDFPMLLSRGSPIPSSPIPCSPPPTNVLNCKYFHKCTIAAILSYVQMVGPLLQWPILTIVIITVSLFKSAATMRKKKERKKKKNKCEKNAGVLPEEPNTKFLKCCNNTDQRSLLALGQAQSRLFLKFKNLGGLLISMLLKVWRFV